MPDRLPPPGTFVWIRRRRWRVRESRRDQTVVRLDVDRGDERRTFLSPFDVVTTEALNRRPKAARRQHLRQALRALAGRSVPGRGVASAVAARVDILPHQLEPVLAVVRGATRVLIADDVGLGKTIQAGLIARQVIARRPDARILVVLPPGLVDQWAAELGARLDLSVDRADRAHLERDRALRPAGDDPWRPPGVRLVSTDFVRQPHVADAVPCVPWDLLIVDEAHGVCGDSLRYRIVARLARDAQRVVLLTATPHSGDPVRFDRLCRLGSLGARGDDLVVFRRARSDVGGRHGRRVSCHYVRLGRTSERLIATLLDFERTVLRHAGAGGKTGAVLLLSVFRKRVLSTAHAALVTFRRRLEWLDSSSAGADASGVRQPPLPFADDDEDADTWLSMRSGLPAAIERRWLGRLAELATQATAEESKVTRVGGLLLRTIEPAIVFTEFRASVPVLVARLSALRAVAVIHGGLSPVERSDALRSFAEGRASVLVATDVASQGLNLQQAARWVVSLDLPWNPARLEQRIGRVDRIGQARPVHLTLIAARHAADTRLLTHLRRRVRAADRAVGRGPVAELLRGVPGEDAIRNSIVAGDPISETATSALPSCKRFARPARHHASALGQIRRLGGIRADRPAEGRPVSGPGVVRTGAPVLWFEVVVRNVDGAVIERTPAAVRVNGATRAGHLTAAVIGRAMQAVERARASRRRRLGRWIRASGLAVRERLDVTRARLEAARGALGVQPGLFDRRAEAIWLADEGRLALSIEDVERALAALDDPTLSTDVALRVVLWPS